MTWICLVFVPLITACRMSRFTKEENVALENHLIKIVTADRPIKCREDCLDTPSCFSVNVHAQKLSSGWVTCDLNNSSKTADPQDLVPKRGYQYLPMAKVSHCTVDQCIYKDALPDSWFIYGSHKLKIFPEKRTWESARTYCQSIGGDLVSINSEDKNEFITHLLGRYITNVTAEDHPRTLARWHLDGTDPDVTLENEATFREEGGFQSLYLNGSGHATVPAVDFGRSSFTIACWVKIQSPASATLPVFSDWTNPLKFQIVAYDAGGNLFFGCVNNFGNFLPWFIGGSAPIDKWFHMAAYWDRNANEAGFFRDGLLVSYQALVNGSYLRGNDHAVYDIGLKRDDGKTFKGHLRDLMIIGEALTAEDLNSILTGPVRKSHGGVWIGLNDTFQVWSDGSHVVYTKWATGQPDNQNDFPKCTEMAVDGGHWDDTICTMKRPFICQKEN